MRLQKILAEAGLGSRRACEQLILDGRVEVDGSIVTELGTRIDTETQAVYVDAVRISTQTQKVYLVLNKPAGVVSTMSDPDGRPCLADYVKNRVDRLFHVGRLDTETEGLILLTNDGELSNRLAHPRYEIPKTYLAQVRGQLAKDVGSRLKAGMDLDDGFVKVDSFKLVDSTPGKSVVELTLHSGRNRIVRRLLKEVGHPVERLVRTKFGPITLDEQRQGKIRPLRSDEIGELFEAVGL
ncbi:MAG: pseudouridine synthase [Brevibacterium aurantiacum]|uniref:Pseudouridine synthase n=1 Tax=Brevibacterium aurantiacum TaxID=273384 RepID=A0A1D7W536_BREAU|nr:pseudouridine synthase [Brevibacterium aurantiacum]AOP54094.1 Ribosomal large subunit pseudouridine synthase B [Brevibacterium aurantiacum]MDN5593449.1 rRNA pseudouridine synthase [Brevibacterium sp.]MDN5607039.1 rRNA pseudouridine synthase [Brevibacterium sp.]MDN5659133.1 rRNA pseudouridine synthase [Brevibacterium aurantiacum]